MAKLIPIEKMFRMILSNQCSKNYSSLLYWKRCCKLAVLGSCVFFIQSCATYGDHAKLMRDGLLQGKPELSLAIAELQDPQQKEVISSLDKGMLRRMTEDFAGSNQILEIAKREIEKLYGTSITENLASLTINDTMRGFEGDRYEQLLLHAFMAMNYIQLGQLDGARVEMLQANVKMMEWGEEPEEDAFLRYLEGIIYENLGEVDSALISYRKAYTIYKEKGGVQYPSAPTALKTDLLRMLARQGLWDELGLYKKEFNMPLYKPGKDSKQFGELVVILNNGLAPIRTEASVMIFSSEVQQTLRVSFPAYAQKKISLNTPLVYVNDSTYAMEMVEDIDALARYSLGQDIAEIMIRATARAVVKYNTQHTAQDKGSIVGLLMTVTNLVTEQADTRSWSTLPQEIQLTRIQLPVGEQQVQLQLLNADGQIVDSIDESVFIKPSGSTFLIKHWNTPRAKPALNKADSAITTTVINTQSPATVLIIKN